MSIELKTKIADTIKVLGAVSLPNLINFADQILGVLTLLVGLSYTIWKWRRDIKKASNV